MKAVKQFIQQKFPEFYKTLRKDYLNTYNHCLWLSIYHFHRSTPSDPYHAEFWEGQKDGNYQEFATAILEHFPAQSIIDIGCGSGNLLKGFHQVNPCLNLVGMDNSDEAIALASQSFDQIHKLNITELSNQEIYQLCQKIGQFDLTVCLEVAEHLRIWHLPKLLKLLTSTSQTLIFSAAQPGQGGILHLNEQPPDYWIRQFAKMQYTFNQERSQQLKKHLENINIPYWYKDNLLVFQKASLKECSKTA